MSQPTVEDFGEAQLVGGRAYVPVEPHFANAIEQNSGYMVFIMPEGDSRGLYVTHKTMTGFEVRENERGSSTLAFSYRIAAKPYGSHEARLPMVSVPKRGSNRAIVRHVPANQ